ncbi:MAG TPA: N-acetylmuramoyl-L-alanine amidase [Thermoanaerobaculia bacterium]|nr:N-acetylmuramoyl-L-alanine amidase [Thermoanaerobaculia bacterium]
MTGRRPLASLPLLLLLLPVLVIAQSQRATAPGTPAAPPAGPGSPSVTLDGREVRVPALISPGGPLFGLKALTEVLGGELTPGETGESYNLKLGGKEVVIGLGSAVITVGDNIVSLSQPPTRGEGGVAVPVDFLNKTYGDLSGYSFEWRPEQQRLAIGRRSARELPVTLDVVHLQGMTTVVLQFTEAPRYHLSQQPGRVEVQMLSDRLAVPSPARRVDDPLVKGVEITPERVRIELATEAAVESYTLDNPFRLVFDVHGESSVASPSGPAFTPSLPASGIHTIVIDPGHGGTETGAIGPGGIQEKGLTLLLAQALASRLQQRLAVRVVLTRSEDTNLPLDTRAAIANQNRADLFISIHLNSSLGAGAHGAETYFLSSQATDTRAASAATTENGETAGAAAAPAGTEAAQDDLRLILWDLAQTRHLTESQRLAALIQGELNETLQLKDRGVKQAPFRVLMGAAMPAVLVEVGFISNPEEEGKLQDAAYRADLVEALVRAVTRYKELSEAPEKPAGAAPAPGAPGNTGNPAAAPAAPATPPAASTAPSAPGARPAPPPPSPGGGPKPPGGAHKP